MKRIEPAADCWEVERRSNGEMLRPYCVVVLRSKKDSGKSIVTASSSDFESMNRYAEHLTEDLYTLTNDEFVQKYKLSNAS
ncbi:MAG TPA: hypothetical protein VGK34_05705 [Armatimonadota bacterium]